MTDINLMGLPFYVRLSDAVSNVFPPFVVHAIRVFDQINGVTQKEPFVRRVDPAKVLSRIQLIESDEAFRQYILCTRSVRDVRTALAGCHCVLSAVAADGPGGRHYENVRKQLGQNPKAVEIAKIGLVSMMNQKRRA